MHFPRPSQVFRLSLLLLSLLTGISVAQVAVYEMELEKEDRSINFSFFEDGFLVLDALEGSGSFLFTYRDREQGVYVRAPDSANTFIALKGEQRKMVLRATAQTDTSISHYLAIGELDDEVITSRRGQTLRLEVANRLRGHVLASDDESDIEFPVTEETLGFAGMASIELDLDTYFTREANTRSQTVAESIEMLAEKLEEDGFIEESATEDDDGGEGGDDDDGITPPEVGDTP